MQKYLIYVLSSVLIILALLLAMLVTERKIALGRVALLEEANGYCRVALEKSGQIERLRERLESAYRRVLNGVLSELRLKRTDEPVLVEEVVKEFQKSMGGPE